jgi:hypothetical protein
MLSARSANGTQDGYATIDDVRLFTDNNRPIAQNDQQTLVKGIPTTLNLLTNDGRLGATT